MFVVGLLIFVLVAYPVFLLICTIAGGGDSSGDYFSTDCSGSNDSSNNSLSSDSSSWDGYKYSQDNCYCECDDCYDNDDCDCDCN